MGVSFSLLMCYREGILYTEAQGLVEVDLSTILERFCSSQFMSCPRAMSFFQRLCPAPFPPISFPSQRFYSHILMGSRGVMVIYNCFKAE